jgi:hypothetical protein
MAKFFDIIGASPGSYVAAIRAAQSVVLMASEAALKSARRTWLFLASASGTSTAF